MVNRPLRFDSFRSSSERASKTAARIKSKNTKGEVLLRSTLWKRGLRFRKNFSELPGKPDLAFMRERVAVFVDGDFWHGRDWEKKKAALESGSNAPYWLSKIEGNINRDQRTNELLKELKWHVVRFWESDILVDPDAIANQIATLILSIRAHGPNI